MLSHELRTKYLKFFEGKGHLIYPSDSLVPDDSSLLYTSAGMVQFKVYFVGDRVPPCNRIVTCQKCLRTDDIDEVGDAGHHTFFEMLGNFSFGDYFKHESIIWAWEFMTEVLKLNPDDLWTSVYLDDDEAAEVWAKEIKLPEDRIVRLGADKNYWPPNAPEEGPNGVCGPCNEIFLDLTPELGPPKDPTWSIAHEGNRFIEFWNLVFTQFDRLEDGTMRPLPSKNIDTGLGFERVARILQGTPTDYETDLFLPIVQRIESISGVRYGSDEKTDFAIRVIADHIRSAVFVIGDGVMPSNVGRGYVLRRLIRNSIVKARKLGVDKPFMTQIVPVVVEIMGNVYHEIADRQGYIEKLIGSEEEKFRSTLQSGLQRLEDQIVLASSSPAKQLDGESAFTLYDTYGFPLELTREIAAENGIAVDEDGFKAAMEEQRKRAKDASDFGAVMAASEGSVLLELEKTVEPTQFLGYEATESEATVVAILKGGELASSADEGEEVEIVLDRTPFYAESGGQVGDTGEIISGDTKVEVLDTVKASHFYFHRSKVLSDAISVGDAVRARVDAHRRLAIARNHTATHLLHAALHKVLGEHALQKGSIVDPDRLRFDFSHFQAVTPEEMRAIEDEVNSMILSDIQAETNVTTLKEARDMGATALFGEKYGDQVRMVKMGPDSIELCGGTHVSRTSQIGMLKILSESSIGAGLRRIEAVTGSSAMEYVRERDKLLGEVAEVLKTSPAEAPEAAARMAESLRAAEKQLERLQRKTMVSQADEIAGQAVELKGINLIAARVDAGDVEAMSALADSLAKKLKSVVIVLGGPTNGKVAFVGKVTPDLVQRGFHAGNLIREVAKVAGGGGGGRPDFAQAGGKDANKLDEALAKAREIVEQQAGA